MEYICTNGFCLHIFQNISWNIFVYFYQLSTTSYRSTNIPIVVHICIIAVNTKSQIQSILKEIIPNFNIRKLTKVQIPSIFMKNHSDFNIRKLTQLQIPSIFMRKTISDFNLKENWQICKFHPFYSITYLRFYIRNQCYL